MSAIGRLTMPTLLAATALWAFGCAGTSYERAEARVESLREVRDSLTQGKAQIDGVALALDQVVAKAKADPRPEFDHFTKSLAKLDSISEDARKRADALRTRSENYFAAWEKEMADAKSPQLVVISKERREKAMAEFAKLQSDAQVLREAYGLLSSDLHDLKKYLGNNLNATGIVAVSDNVKKVKESGRKVNLEIDKVSAKLTTIADALSPTGKEAAIQPASASTK